MADKDVLAEEKEAFEEAMDAESENRIAALDDIKFSRLGEQWPEKIKKERESDDRPCLTNNLLPAFIRQVVNDSRQNKPQIKVKPVDSGADPATAHVMGNIIRHIEAQSRADIAYDTAVDFAASMGFGYLRVAIEYEYDDSFNKSLCIKQVPNPFAVYGDPHSTSADGSDWDRGFVTDLMSKDNFESQYKGAEKVDWIGSGYDGLNTPWRQDGEILVCESWKREKVDRKILLLTNGQVVGEKEYKAGREFFNSMGIGVEDERVSKSYKVTQRIMTGAEILEENEWAGIYIPIIPVYGEEINIEGKRHFRSLIRDAKDAQRQANYWNSSATELVALAPRVPFIGEEGAFDVEGEANKWLTANKKSWAFLQYKKGRPPPMRQPLDSGSAAGSITESIRSVDNMKAIMGLYDASLGKRSNETSGVAITARQREGDISTFHIHDNLSRSIRHTGCILVDLIPKVYSEQMVMRLSGEDGADAPVTIGPRPEGQPATPPEPTQEQVMKGERPTTHPNGMEHIYDLGLGKYDVVIDTGPSVTTQREETAQQMMELLKAFPQAAPLIGDLLVKNLNWAQSDEIAKRLKAMMPQQAQGGIPPELDQMIKEGQQLIQQQGQELQQLKQELGVAKSSKQLSDQSNAIKLQSKDLVIQEMKAVEAIEDAAQQAAQAVQPQEQPGPQEQAPPQINLIIPEGLGTALGNAVVQGAQSLLGNMPPLNVNMPSMKRTAFRGQDGQITHSIDEPMQIQ